jgi:hypothetical protein
MLASGPTSASPASSPRRSRSRCRRCLVSKPSARR